MHNVEKKKTYLNIHLTVAVYSMPQNPSCCKYITLKASTGLFLSNQKSKQSAMVQSHSQFRFDNFQTDFSQALSNKQQKNANVN